MEPLMISKTSGVFRSTTVRSDVLTSKCQKPKYGTFRRENISRFHVRVSKSFDQLLYGGHVYTYHLDITLVK